jgi:hypothetical protein
MAAAAAAVAKVELATARISFGGLRFRARDWRRCAAIPLSLAKWLRTAGIVMGF